MRATEINRILATTGRLQLPPGPLTVEESIRIPGGARLEGAAGLGTELHGGGSFPVVHFDMADGASLAGVRIRHEVVDDTGVPAHPEKRHIGVLISGRDIVVERVRIENGLKGVMIHESGTNIVLRDVRFRHTNAGVLSSAFGLDAKDVDGLTIDDCHWEGAWLDGIKLRRACRNVLIRDGSSNGNGRSAAGDGIDCFPGGESVTIRRTVFEGNQGNGIVIKTIGPSGDRSIPFNPEAGDVRKYRIEHVTVRGNMYAGIAIEPIYDHGSMHAHRPKLTEPSQNIRTRAFDIRVRDSEFLDNGPDTGWPGAIVNGLQCRFTRCTFRSNYREGIRIGENARVVRVEECDIIGCSVMEEGDPAVLVERGASCVELRGLVINGKQAGGRQGRTLHEHGILVEGDPATAIRVVDCRNDYTKSDDVMGAAPVESHQELGTLHVEHAGSRPSPNGYLCGGPGSIYRRHITGFWAKLTRFGRWIIGRFGGGPYWIKASGPARSKSGWVRR